jgi:hypothetical protein
MYDIGLTYGSVLMKLCTFLKEGENCILVTQALAKINFSLGDKGRVIFLR